MNRKEVVIAEDSKEVSDESQRIQVPEVTYVRDYPDLVEQAKSLSGELLNTIFSMERHRGEVFLKWLKLRNKYLGDEEKSDPSRERAYYRGEIVMVNFGFNVGSEYGGLHPAVVIEDSPMKSQTVVVIPLGSRKIKEGKPVPIRQSQVLLGQVEHLRQADSLAHLNQIRAISKLRIVPPYWLKEQDRKSVV